MLECNRYLRRKVALLKRVLAFALPAILILLLLAQIAFAKNTYRIHDGGRVTVYTTYATDPAVVLDEAGLQLNAEDTYVTQVIAGVSEITIQRKQQVRIVMGGKELVACTYGETVGALLDRLGIQLAEEDILSEKRSSFTYDGMTVTISQGITRQEQNTVTIPFTTEYCYDASIPEGQQVVLTAGSDGQAMQIVSVSYADGKEISRTVLSQEILVQPVNALIAIGTKQPEVERPVYAPARPAPEAPQLPTVGDGVIVTPDGEVLTYTSSKQMVATAYTSTDPGCSIWTYTGTMCHVGTIAVDPTVIPYGTRMYIVTNDGAYVYGIAVAEDCGGAIKGDKIDLYFETEAECWQFGIRECTVYFLD